jgi:hypothetical protein
MGVLLMKGSMLYTTVMVQVNLGRVAFLQGRVMTQ